MLSGRPVDLGSPSLSTEVQRYTNHVLRRDASKTDYILIPLVAGVMVRCILAEDSEVKVPEEQEPLRRDALARVGAVMALVGRAERGDSWESEDDAYGAVADLVLRHWPSLMAWGSLSFQWHMLEVPPFSKTSGNVVAAAKALDTIQDLSLTEAVILASGASVAPLRQTERIEVPLFGKPARKLRVVLADRLRRLELNTWPAVLLAAVNDWTPGTLERLAYHHAAAGVATIARIMEMMEEESLLQSAREAEAEAVSGAAAAIPYAAGGAESNALAPASIPTSEPHPEAVAAAQLVEDAVQEISHWRGQHDQVQRERNVFATRDARSRSRIETLEREAAAMRADRVDLERQVTSLRAERDELLERIAVEETLTGEAPPAATDAFVGRRVLLFTGVEAADARAALAHGFRQLGAAHVDCYWTDKTRGPETFPADAIVAVDVTQMAHTVWHKIQDRARAAGAWCYSGRHGAAKMARATAAAWERSQERGGQLSVAGNR